MRSLLRTQATHLLALSALVFACSLQACAEPVGDDADLYAEEFPDDEETATGEQAKASALPCWFFGGRWAGPGACRFFVATAKSCNAPGVLKREGALLVCEGRHSAELGQTYRPHTFEQVKFECGSRFYGTGVKVEQVSLGQDSSGYYFGCAISSRGDACRKRGGILKTSGNKTTCTVAVPVLRR